MDRRLVLGIVFLGILTLTLISPQSEEPQTELVEAQDNNYTIGVLSITKLSEPYYQYLGNLVIEEINDYCVEAGLDYRFSASYTCSDSRAQLSQENTEMFHEAGINLAVGYAWSSGYCAGLNGYGEENGMVIISTGSTSPAGCCRKVDHGFRLYPYDGLQDEPLAFSLIDKGYTNLVIISRKDSWASSILETLEPVYIGTGGRIQAVIEYPVETEDESFRQYVKLLHEEYKNSESPDSTAILAVSFSEIYGLLNEASGYPELLNITWFGSDATALLDELTPETGRIASQVKMISPYVKVPNSTLYDSINMDFMAKYHTPLTLQLCNLYDSIWLMALSVIEAGSDDADAISDALMNVTESYTGLSGEIGFDEYGDRLPIDYEYWGVLEVDGEYINTVIGYYDSETGTIEWINLASED